MWREFKGDDREHVYSNCRELYEKMKPVWDKSHDVDELIKTVFK
jgi:hypothetical protein